MDRLTVYSLTTWLKFAQRVGSWKKDGSSGINAGKAESLEAESCWRKLYKSHGQSPMRWSNWGTWDGKFEDIVQNSNLLVN